MANEKVPFSMEAVEAGYWELYHDDDCGETLIMVPGHRGYYCPKCHFCPDLQSKGARRTGKVVGGATSVQSEIR